MSAELKDWSIRQKSAEGKPKPTTSIERTCQGCGASFLGLAPGKTGERGVWREWCWFCSSAERPANGRSYVLLLRPLDLLARASVALPPHRPRLAET